MGGRRHYRSFVADSARWDGFEFRTGDIIISTPPKSGTTWMQMLVALLVFGGPDFGRPLANISPWLDMQLTDRDEVFARLAGQRHRRFIKSHTPLDGLPDHPGVTYICVGRDPRDVAVSATHHMANMNLSQMVSLRQRAVGLEDAAQFGIDLSAGLRAPYSIRDFLESSLDNAMSLAYVLNHLVSSWQRRDDPRVALFHYSDLQADLPRELRRLAAVLDTELPEHRFAELAGAATFSAMRDAAEQVAPNSDQRIWNNTSEFFHRGTNGQWRDAFDVDLLRRYDERVAELASPELATWAHEGWAAEGQRRGSFGPVTPQ